MNLIINDCVNRLARIYHDNWIKSEKKWKRIKKESLDRYIPVNSKSLCVSRYPNIPDKYKKIVLEKIVNDEIIPAHIEIDFLNLTFDQLPIEYQNSYKKIARKAIELMLNMAKEFHEFWLEDNKNHESDHDYQIVNRSFNDLDSIYKGANTKYLEEALYILKEYTLM